MKRPFRNNIPGNRVGTQFKVTKILVVEDDKTLVEILEYLFDQEHYKIKMVNKVENIVPLVEDFQPDLVLLDYLLPTVNGGELCSQIKQNMATCNIPVVIFSAYPKAQLSPGEWDAFIAKPFDLDNLVFQIEKCLEKRMSHLTDHNKCG